MLCKKSCCALTLAGLAFLVASLVAAAGVYGSLLFKDVQDAAAVGAKQADIATSSLEKLTRQLAAQSDLTLSLGQRLAKVERELAIKGAPAAEAKGGGEVAKAAKDGDDEKETGKGKAAKKRRKGRGKGKGAKGKGDVADEDEDEQPEKADDDKKSSNSTATAASEAEEDEEEGKGKGKGGGGGGKGWGKMGGGGGMGGKGKWKFVRFRKELTPEEIEERRQANAERHATRIEKEERKVLTEVAIEGEVVQRAKWHAWLMPKDPEQIPVECREALTAMNAEFRAKVTDGRAFCGGIESDVIYLAVADIAEEGLVLRSGLPVKFKVYSDNKGVGACDVISGEPKPEAVAAAPPA